MRILSHATAQATRAYGERLVLKRISGGTYNPTTLTVDGETELSVEVFGIVTDVVTERVSTGLEVGDLFLRLSHHALATTEFGAPQSGDQIERDGITYRVIAAPEETVGGNRVGWLLHLRGA